MDNYKYKYLKYKHKYNQVKLQQSGGFSIPADLKPSFDSGKGDPLTQRRLALVELIDFKGVNEQNWDILRQIYDKDAIITMANTPFVIKGIEENIKMMKEMSKFSSDSKIIKHEIQFGSGDWTALTFLNEGTFNGPYFDPLTQKTFQPNGKKYKLYGCSLMQWNGEKIIKELVFWDDASFKTQLGIKD